MNSDYMKWYVSVLCVIDYFFPRFFSYGLSFDLRYVMYFRGNKVPSVKGQFLLI